MRWEERAACRDDPHPDAWFPRGGNNNADAERALRICMACPVAAECLEDALTFERETREPKGIRGRMTQAQRAQLVEVD